MNNYLVTFLIKESVDEKGRKELLDSVKAKIAGKTDSAKASSVKEDLWGVRPMSYPILHQSKAFYAHYEFQAEPNSISDIDKTLKLNEDVIRYLIVKV